MEGRLQNLENMYLKKARTKARGHGLVATFMIRIVTSKLGLFNHIILQCLSDVVVFNFVDGS